MATNKPSRGIGPVPEGLGEGLTDFLHQLRRQALDVMAGRTAVSGSGSSGGSGGSTIIIGGPGSGGTVEPDLTPPPTPTGVNVVAGIDFVGVTSDPPVFAQGHGYLATLVYGKKYAGSGPLPTYSDNSKQFEFTGEVGTFPTDPATQWHIWVKWKTKDGVVSLAPAGGTNGFQVTTGQDVSKLLTALAAKIRNEQLDPTSNFIYRVNSFTIAPPAGTSGVANIVPFSVLTVPTLTSAGELLPAGVYMEAAYIKNLDVALGRFQNAFITNAMIVSVSASRITSGVISVGNYIQSSNYVPGTSGWRIHGNGTGEFRGLQIGGDSYFDGQVTIRAPGGRIILQSGGKLAAGDITPDSGWLNSNVGALNMVWEVNSVQAGPGQYGMNLVALKTPGVNPHALKPGEQITISADVWQDGVSAAAGQYAQLYLYCTDGAGVWTGYTVTISNSGQTSVGSRGSATLTLPDDAQMQYIWVGVYHQGGSSNTAGAVYADRIQVERGSVATQYKRGTQPGATVGAPNGTLVGGQEAGALVSAAAAAQSAAAEAGTNASSALVRLQAIDSDGVLSRGEKPEVIAKWQAIYNEGPGIDAQAAQLGITTERTAWANAKEALRVYLVGLTPAYSDTTQDTVIVPAVDRVKWADYYSARQTLLNKIAAVFGSAGGVNMVWGANAISAGPGVYGVTLAYLKMPDANRFGLLPGEQLTISADVWQDGASAAAGQYASVYLYCMDAAYGWTGSTVVIPGSGQAQAGSRGTATLTLPADAQMRYIAVGLYHQGGSGSNAGTVLCDRVQVERGPVATQYSPGAEPGATVGATLGVNVSGKITQLNASTLIDTAAINGAMIGELIAENIVLTQLSRAQNGLPSGAALSGRRVQSVPGGLEFYRDNGTRSVVIVA